MLGFTLSTFVVLAGDLGSAEGVDDLEAGDIDIHKTEAGDGSAKGGLIPKILEAGRNCLKIIKIPVFSPGENDQKRTDLENEQGQRNSQQPPLPADFGPRTLWKRGCITGLRIRVGQPRGMLWD